MPIVVTSVTQDGLTVRVELVARSGGNRSCCCVVEAPELQGALADVSDGKSAVNSCLIICVSAISYVEKIVLA